jgi:hypothetical protein
MPYEVEIKDANGNPITIWMEDVGTSGSPVLVPVSVPFDQFGAPLFTEESPGAIAEVITAVSASFTRPNDTATYSIGDLIANDTAAINVVPMRLDVGRIVGAACQCSRARLLKSNETNTNAIIRAHLYSENPTITNGDNAAWQTNSAGYLGSYTFDFTGSNVRVFTDGSNVIAAPDVGVAQIMNLDPALSYIFALLEDLDGHTPAASEQFTLTLEIKQN